MSIEAQLTAIAARLDAAIKSTLENELADEIKKEMSENIEKYAASFTQSRGPFGGGVRDKRMFKVKPVEVDKGEPGGIGIAGDDTYYLEVQDVAPFQKATRKDKSLAEVVEEGDERYHIYFGRPFIGPTQMVMDYGLAEAVIVEGLRDRGFVVVG